MKQLINFKILGLLLIIMIGAISNMFGQHILISNEQQYLIANKVVEEKQETVKFIIDKSESTISIIDVDDSFTFKINSDTIINHSVILMCSDENKELIVGELFFDEYDLIVQVTLSFLNNDKLLTEVRFLVKEL